MPDFLPWLFRVAGIVFIVFFLVAKRLKRNRWGGIRFSYTLADDEVWRKVHARCRWGFLFSGIVCFWPVDSIDDLTAFSITLVGVLIATSLWAYVYARSVYQAKYGTTNVVCRGLFRYAPPDDRPE